MMKILTYRWSSSQPPLQHFISFLWVLRLRELIFRLPECFPVATIILPHLLPCRLLMVALSMYYTHLSEPPDKKLLKSKREEESSGSSPIMRNRRRSYRKHPFNDVRSSNLLKLPPSTEGWSIRKRMLHAYPSMLLTNAGGAIPTWLIIGNALLTAPRDLATRKHLADSFSNHSGSSSPTRVISRWRFGLFDGNALLTLSWRVFFN